MLLSVARWMNGRRVKADGGGGPAEVVAVEGGRMEDSDASSMSQSLMLYPRGR